MDNFTLESVKEAFGTCFQQYCLNRKIILKRNENGAFMVPSVSILEECLNFLDELKLKLNCKLNTLQKSSPVYLNNGDCYHHVQSMIFSKLFLKSTSNCIKNSLALCSIYSTDTIVLGSNKQHKFKIKKKSNFHNETAYTVLNLFLINLPLKVYLYDTSPILPSHTFQSIPIKCILDTVESGNEIYGTIINKTMENVIVLDYEASIPSVALLLEQFQKQHRRFHYWDVLKHLTYKQEHQNTKFDYEVNIKDMKLFFDLVFAKVIPLKIFGKLRNIKKIKKALFHLLNTQRFKAFDLTPYINKLDIFSIKWLENIESAKIAWLIIAKFVKWFFTGYLIKILYRYFHVTTVSINNNKRLYISRSNWCNLHKKFIKNKERSNAVQADIKFKGTNELLGIYKLYAKNYTVRPIFVPQYEKNEKEHLYVLQKFLKQLHVTEYGLTSFEKEWRSIAQNKCTLNSKRFYLVSCDVTDAFGSVRQEQLFDIIQSLCEKLPENLILRSYAIKSKMSKDNVVCYKQYICDSHLKLPLAPGTLYVRTNCTQRIKRSWLLYRIWKYIFYQKVKVGKKYYIIGKGITQGTMLSPILSDIYLDFVQQKQMTLFLNAGKIIRYVDDILFVTESEVFAKQFLQLITKGIPEYNCRFKKSKMQTNMVYDGNTVVDHIIYIDYKVNCNTLEIEPNIPNSNLCYLMSFSSKQNLSPLEFLKQRLSNSTSLRLSKLVLDDRINSKVTIKRILEKACFLQAQRACILIKGLFDNVQDHVQSIFKIIKYTNKKVTRYIITVFLKLDEKMNESCVYMWNQEILRILWTSYKNVFMEDKILQQNFTKYFIK